MRARIFAPEETPDSSSMSDALAQLNDMMFGWKQLGVDVGHTALTLDDEFVFFVPPIDAVSDTISALSFQGGWDASANTPSLSTGVGTDGFVYRVTTAGASVLDDVSSWALNDYAAYCDQSWLKGRSSRPFEGTVIAMLSFQLASDHGKDPPAVVVQEARGWRHIQSCFVKPKMNDNVDLGLVNMPSRRFVPDGTLLS